MLSEIPKLISVHKHTDLHRSFSLVCWKTTVNQRCDASRLDTATDHCDTSVKHAKLFWGDGEKHKIFLQSSFFYFQEGSCDLETLNVSIFHGLLSKSLLLQTLGWKLSPKSPFANFAKHLFSRMIYTHRLWSNWLRFYERVWYFTMCHPTLARASTTGNEKQNLEWFPFAVPIFKWRLVLLLLCNRAGDEGNSRRNEWRHIP